MKRALIFGASGFAGSHLVNELLKHDYEVYGCSHYSTLSDSRLSGAIVCDIMDEDRVRATVSKVSPDCIFNMAGSSSVGVSWSVPQSTVSINVIGTLNILEAVRALDSEIKVLCIGSSEEYAAKGGPLSEEDPLDASNPYGISKLMLDKYCALYREHFGMKVYHVRAFNHTGVGQADTFVIPSWCKQAARISGSGAPGTMRVGNLSVSRDFSDVRDIVRAYRLVLEQGDCNKIYNIGSGRSMPLKDILEFITSLSTQPISIEVNEKLIRPTEIGSICCDHSRLTQDTGWEPQYRIEDTIHEIYEYFEKRSLVV